jgi:hypothetical protein
MLVQKCEHFGPEETASILNSRGLCLRKLHFRQKISALVWSEGTGVRCVGVTEQRPAARRGDAHSDEIKHLSH